MKDYPLLTPEELKKHLSATKTRGLALDIDETLGRTDHHWLDHIFAALGTPEGATKEELVRKYRYVEHMPFWTKDQLDGAVGHLFHSNEFQTGVPLIENADAGVNRINEIVPVVAYITARPVTVESGTRTWLKNHGFPDVPLVLKPLDHTHERRNSWKADVLRALYPGILGIIDDNPGLADELSSDYEGAVFVYGSAAHPKQNGRIIPCADWEAAIAAVEAFASGRAIE